LGINLKNYFEPMTVRFGFRCKAYLRMQQCEKLSIPTRTLSMDSGLRNTIIFNNSGQSGAKGEE
jgi:hypothetical protein